MVRFNDLPRVQLKNDNAQGFDNQVRRSNSLQDKKFPIKIVLEVLKNQLHFSDELKPFTALYLQDTVQKGEAASYSRLKETARRYVEQNMRDKPALKKRLFMGQQPGKDTKRKS